MKNIRSAARCSSAAVRSDVHPAPNMTCPARRPRGLVRGTAIATPEVGRRLPAEHARAPRRRPRRLGDWICSQRRPPPGASAEHLLRRRSSTPFPQISLPSAVARRRRRRRRAGAARPQSPHLLQLRDRYSGTHGVLDFVRGAGVSAPSRPSEPEAGSSPPRPRAVLRCAPPRGGRRLLRRGRVRARQVAATTARTTGARPPTLAGARAAEASPSSGGGGLAAGRPQHVTATQVQARHRGRAARTRQLLKEYFEIVGSPSAPGGGAPFASPRRWHRLTCEKQAEAPPPPSRPDRDGGPRRLLSSSPRSAHVGVGATVSASEWAEGVARYNGAGYRDALGGVRRL